MHYSNHGYSNSGCDNIPKQYDMKFYNREKELLNLQTIDDLANSTAQMTVLVGRRRIGKTSLLRKSIENQTAIYLFLAKKSEVLICEELVEAIEQSLQIQVLGEFHQFKNLFRYLMELSKTRKFTLIIDEFQEFLSINPSIYSDMQNIWDSQKQESKINLIFCGSIYSLMKKIFENSKEPLFGRATNRIHLKPFSIETIKEILKDNSPRFTNDDLLSFYLITGGVAKYVEILVSRNAFTLSQILDEIFREDSLFLDEGRNVLIEVFGKDYATYFSILSLIASSKTSRSDIESILEMSIGGYLDKMENDYNLIRKVKPLFSKAGSRTMKYAINDNFLTFWFRFIYKYRSAIEIGNYGYVRNIVERDYTMYSGSILEKYFTEKMVASFQFSEIGSYWESGNQNEIDIVALNDFEKKVVFVEVKRKKENISLNKLEEKSTNLIKKINGYSVEYKGFSIEDM